MDTSRRGMVRLTQHQPSSHHRLRRLVRAHVSFRRRLLRSIVAVLVLAACAVAVIVAQDLLAAAGGGADDDNFVPFPDGLAQMPNLHNRRASNSSSNHSSPSLSECRTWIPTHSSSNSNLASFDLVRSCAVESALSRSAATPVCILLNK